MPTGKPKAARDILIDALRSWGIDTTGEISGLVDKYIKTGVFNGNTNADTVQLYLQDTREWKQRFAGIEMLKKNHPNVPVPSIAEYLSTERTMAQVMQAAGMPKGFYDSHSDFATFIGNNMSPAELQSRVQAASDAALNLDPGFKDYLTQAGYGDLTRSHLAAYMLDPKRALPVIQRDLEAAKIAGVTGTHGFHVSNGEANHLQSLGLTEAQLRNGLDQASQVYSQAQHLGAIYGHQYGQTDALNEFLDGSPDAFNKRMGLVNQEKSQFAGSSAVGSGSLGRDIGSY